MKSKKEISIAEILSIEFGYKMCEKGYSLQEAINKYKNIICDNNESNRD